VGITRRTFLAGAGVAAGAGFLPSSYAETPGHPEIVLPQPGDWNAVRGLFRLDPERIHLAALLLASHPAPVAGAVQGYRRALDHNPAEYVQENRWNREHEVRHAAADHMGARWQDVAVTDSTTQGTALVYNGMQVREGQELLTTTEDYYATHRSLLYKAQRTGARKREIPLFENIHTVTQDEIVDSLMTAVRAETRALALTWVHSKTGLKIPVRQIADALAERNAGRDPADRALLCIDGVHGLGVEDAGMEDLGCDFFMAGTHKWVFAPRGTGVIWGHPRTQDAVTPTIPTFTPDETWGGHMTPGGYKPFEHQWAMEQAFELHRHIGRARVAERVHALSRQLKEGLAEMPHVTLYTPIDPALSAGIVCFDVDGRSADAVVELLSERHIVATTTPYSPSHARLTPAIFNTPEDIDAALRAVYELG
jgi:isopenicillin-N epimerase